MSNKMKRKITQDFFMSPSPPNLALPNYLVLKRKYHLIEEHEN